MCGRFTLTSTPEELARRFGLKERPALAPRFNVAPGQLVLGVRIDPDQELPPFYFRKRSIPLQRIRCWG